MSLLDAHVSFVLDIDCVGVLDVFALHLIPYCRDVTVVILLLNYSLKISS